MADDGPQKAVQPGEGEVGLVLHARDRRAWSSRRALGRVAEQRRLADAGLTAQHERAALAARRRFEQSVDQCAFLRHDRRAQKLAERAQNHPSAEIMAHSSLDPLAAAVRSFEQLVGHRTDPLTPDQPCNPLIPAQNPAITGNHRVGSSAAVRLVHAAVVGRPANAANWT